nr:hypothetical protein [Tanacetum cinerariifolium]
HSISYPGTDTSSLVNHNAYMASSSASQIAYAQMDQQSSEYSPPEAGIVVPRDAEWFKDKVLLVQAQANGQVLQEEELEFLTDLEESQNIDRELALEKEVKELNNIVFKRNQSAVPDSDHTLMHAEEIKERTTATTITEETWGFEHTKACFCDDIIPFVKNLKDLFTSFDQYLIDEVSEVQKIFKQMEMAVEQHSAAKTEIQTKMENDLKENDRLLTHALGVDIVNIVVNDCMNVNCLTVDACEQYVTTESEIKTDFIKKENYETDTVSSSESVPTFAELFETNELKAQIQEKDTVILKLKVKIKSFNDDDKERKEESKVEDIETQNLELDHRVTELTAENNHLKQTYKQLFDSIKSSRVQSKEQCDDLINKVNLKSVEVADLNASL